MLGATWSLGMCVETGKHRMFPCNGRGGRGPSGRILRGLAHQAPHLGAAATVLWEVILCFHVAAEEELSRGGSSASQGLTSCQVHIWLYRLAVGLIRDTADSSSRISTLSSSSGSKCWMRTRNIIQKRVKRIVTQSSPAQWAEQLVWNCHQVKLMFSKFIWQSPTLFPWCKLGGQLKGVLYHPSSLRHSPQSPEFFWAFHALDNDKGSFDIINRGKSSGDPESFTMQICLLTLKLLPFDPGLLLFTWVSFLCILFPGSCYICI